MLVKDPNAFSNVEPVDFDPLNLEPMVPQTPAALSRVDQLVAVVDHCTAAIEIAKASGDPFLVYMLSMAAQAARIEMRPKMLRARRK